MRKMATTHPCSNLHHILVVLCLFMLPMLMPAQNITLGSSLTAGTNSTSWSSPSGDFAFGFQPVPYDDNLFLLAIWFDKIEEKTVVWFAKPTNPSNRLVKSGSKVELKRDGRLVLSDPSGDELWNAINTTNNGNTHARMLDNGNFVLVDATTNRFSWQSFENPTDTLLLTQGLKPGINLVALLDDEDINYSDGRFQFSMEENGNVTAYLVSLTGAKYDPPYWGSNTTGNDPNLVFDKLGNVNVVLRNATPVEIMPRPLSSGGLLYQRLTLDVDGVLRHYVYSRNNTRSGTSSINGWNIDGRGIPSNICKSVTTYLGSGACGFNSYCTMGNNGMRNCECPPSYSFLDPKRKYKGCKPNTDIPVCTKDSTTDPTSARYEMVALPNTDFQWGDYEQYMGANNEDTCKTECMKDCFCHVVVYNAPNCWMKQQPLSNGWRDPNKASVLLLKVSKFNTSDFGQQDVQTKRKGSLVSWLLFGSSTTINFLLVAIIIIFVYKGCGRKISNRQPSVDPNLRGSSLQTFTYEELTEATSGFEHELGRGAFGVVYKGTLSLDKPIAIAVKKLSILEKGKEKEFANELKAIGQTYHKNLVRLLGFCNEGQHRLLVYEFMSNCSLTTLLFGVPKPDWNKRMNIANGIASGLLYLHEECATPIVHCDIKPQNVLLDEHFVPKISDFGLAKLLRTEQSKMSTGITGIRGTRGYVAPEWFKRVAITAKVDIYSFGVMLLEIICSRRNVELEFGEGEEAILTDWAYDCFSEGKLDVLLDHNDEPIEEDIRRLERYVMVALWCIQDDPALRPSMKKVVQMLEGAAEVPIPPDPSSFYTSNSSTF